MNTENNGEMPEELKEWIREFMAIDLPIPAETESAELHKMVSRNRIFWKLGAEAMYHHLQQSHTDSEAGKLWEDLSKAKDEENAANNREDDACERSLVLQRKVDSMTTQILTLTASLSKVSEERDGYRKALEEWAKLAEKTGVIYGWIDLWNEIKSLLDKHKP